MTDMKIDILKPNIFDDNVISGVTKSNFDKFEKGFSIFPGKVLTQDEVKHNRVILAHNTNFEYETLKFQKQVHGDVIRKVDIHSSNIAESDGLITNIPRLLLNVTIADCCGILVYDSINKAIGAFHSGWKGTQLNIASAGITAMTEEYATNPRDLKVFLSPCAGGDIYEVGEEVALLFPETVIKPFGDKYLLDVRKRINEQLSELGVAPENIEISDICTIKNPDYHSFRRDKDRSGRMSAFIGLNI